MKECFPDLSSCEMLCFFLHTLDACEKYGDRKCQCPQPALNLLSHLSDQDLLLFQTPPAESMER